MRLFNVYSIFDSDIKIRVIVGIKIVYSGLVDNLLDSSKCRDLLHLSVHSINIDFIQRSVDVYL